MKYSSPLIAFASSALLACGSTPAADVDGSVPGTDSAVAAPSAQPPAPPSSPVAPDGAGTVTFAATKIYMGDTRRDGTPDMSAGWRSYGFDLDHRASTAESTDLCRPRSGAAPRNVYPDGVDGIDNSFGKNILPIVLGLSSDAPTQLNDAIAAGTTTWMLSFDALGSGSDYSPIVGRGYTASMAAAAPRFDGTDTIPVTAESLTDASDILSARASASDAYLVGNTLVMRPAGTVTLAASMMGFTVEVPIGSLVITMELSADHRTATNGTLAGVIPTDALNAELRRVAGAFDPSLCSGPTIDSITAQIEQASDIMADGTQDPTRTCDGISVGMGFDASLVVLGDIAAPAEPGPDPCAL